MSFLAALAALAGCQSGPVNIIHKTGSLSYQRLAVADECKIASFREIPQNLATEYHPGYYSPGTLQCNSMGYGMSCYRVGEVNIAPSTETYDVNDELRGRFIGRCLAAKGYSIIQKPRCPNASQAVDPNSPQPPENQIACAVSEY